jgi:hypothetical protein
MSSFDANGEIEGGIIFFQVKATDNLSLLADGQTISWAISRRDLLLWMNEAYPVILVVYDGQRDRAFWVHVQADLTDRPSPEWFLAGKTMNVHLTRTNRLNRRSVRHIVKRKNTIHSQLQGDLPDV